MAEAANAYVSMPVEELKKQRDLWALSIGRFLMEFTSCEYWTFLYIQTFGSQELRDEAGHKKLKARAELAHGLVSKIGLTKEIQGRIDAAFEQLGKLAVPRNLVAHNGPMFHVFKVPDSETYELRHELRSARDLSKDISIEDLENLFAEASELDQEFALLYGLVRQPRHHAK